MKKFFSPFSMKFTPKTKFDVLMNNLKSVLRYWTSFRSYSASKLASEPKFARGSDRLYGENTKIALTSQGGQILSRDQCRNLFHQISHKKYFW